MWESHHVKEQPRRGYTSGRRTVLKADPHRALVISKKFENGSDNKATGCVEEVVYRVIQDTLRTRSGLVVNSGLFGLVLRAAFGLIGTSAQRLCVCSSQQLKNRV